MKSYKDVYLKIILRSFDASSNDEKSQVRVEISENGTPHQLLAPYDGQLDLKALTRSYNQAKNNATKCEQLGDDLANGLLGEEIKRYLLAQSSLEKPLRLILRFESQNNSLPNQSTYWNTRLAGLPWEFIRLSPTICPARDREFSLVRHQPGIIDSHNPSHNTRSLKLEDGKVLYKAVLAFGYPGKETSLVKHPEDDQDYQEVQEVQNSLAHEETGLTSILSNISKWGEPKVIKGSSLKSISDAYTHGAELFYFYGHARYDKSEQTSFIRLWKEELPDEEQGFEDIKADKLAETLRGGGTRLAILVACQSGYQDQDDKDAAWSSLALQLHQHGIPAVVAMQNDMGAKAGEIFSRRLLSDLAASLSLDEAMARARLEVYTQTDSPYYWALPVLYQYAENGQSFYMYDSATRQKRAELEEEFNRAISIASKNYFEKLNKDFIGRTSLLADLQQKVEGILQNGGNLLLTGEAGQGKSALTAQLVKAYSEAAQPGLVIASHFVPVSAGAGELNLMFKNLIAQIALGIKSLEPEYLNNPNKEKFLWLIKKAENTNQNVLIFLDGIEHLWEEEKRELITNLSEWSDLNLFISTTLKEDVFRQLEIKPVFNNADELLLSFEDFQLLLDARSSRRFTLEEERQVFEILGGNIFYCNLWTTLPTQTLLDFRTIRETLSGRRENIIKLRLDNLQREFENSKTNLYRLVIKPVLKSLAVARGSLTFDSLLSLIRRNNLTIGREDLTKSLSLLLVGVTRTEEVRQEYSLSHSLFKEYILNNQNFLNKDPKDEHRRLADWCWSNLEKSGNSYDRTEEEEFQFKYAIRNYGYHLYDCRDYTSILNILDLGKSEFSDIRELLKNQYLNYYPEYWDLGRRILGRASTEIDITKVIQLWKLTYIRFANLNLFQHYPASYFEVWARQPRTNSDDVEKQVQMLTDRAKKAEGLYRLANVLAEKTKNGQDKNQVEALLKAALDIVYSSFFETQKPLLEFFFDNPAPFEVAPDLLAQMFSRIPALSSANSELATRWLKTTLAIKSPNYALVESIFREDKVKSNLIKLHKLRHSNTLEKVRVSEELQKIENELFQFDNEESSLTCIQQKDFNDALTLISDFWLEIKEEHKAAKFYYKLDKSFDLIEKIKIGVALSRYDLSNGDYLSHAKRAITASNADAYDRIEAYREISLFYSEQHNFKEVQALGEQAGKLIDRTEGVENKIKLYRELAQDQSKIDEAKKQVENKITLYRKLARTKTPDAEDYWKQAWSLIEQMEDLTRRLDQGCKWYLSRLPFDEANYYWRILLEWSKTLEQFQRWFKWVVEGLKLADYLPEKIITVIERASINEEDKKSFKASVDKSKFTENKKNVPTDENLEDSDLRLQIEMHLEAARRLLQSDLKSAPEQALEHLEEVYKDNKWRWYDDPVEQIRKTSELAELYFLCRQTKKAISLWQEAAENVLNSDIGAMSAAGEIATSLARHGLDNNGAITQAIFEQLKETVDSNKDESDRFWLKVLPAQAYYSVSVRQFQTTDAKSPFEDELRQIKNYKRRALAMFEIAKVFYGNRANNSQAQFHVSKIARHWWAEATNLDEALHYFHLIQYVIAFDPSQAEVVLKIFDSGSDTNSKESFS